MAKLQGATARRARSAERWTSARRCAVVGSPITHSLSPALHRAAYAELGLDWTYDHVEVDSAGLEEFVAGLDESWRGLSLTMPLKRTVVPLLDTQRRLGAALRRRQHARPRRGRPARLQHRHPRRHRRDAGAAARTGPLGRRARRRRHGDVGAAGARRVGVYDGDGARPRPGPRRGDDRGGQRAPARARALGRHPRRRDRRSTPTCSSRRSRARPRHPTCSPRAPTCPPSSRSSTTRGRRRSPGPCSRTAGTSSPGSTCSPTRPSARCSG